MIYVPLHPLAGLDRDSASAMFRFWLNGWEKKRAELNNSLSDKHPSPQQGEAREETPVGRAI